MKEPGKSGIPDRDVAESMYRLKTLLWSSVGAGLGALIGTFYSLRADGPALLYIILFAVLLWALVYFGTLFVANRVGSIGSSVYFQGGGSTPARREYSLAESLVARGRYDEALAEYERNVTQHPDDVELQLRIARLQRDAMQQPEAAAQSFRRALAIRGISPAFDALATRELIELYAYRMKQPRRAIPELARLTDRHTDPNVVQWARRELDLLKRAAFSEQENDG
jgi:tetratricopeptide (TPR) repeat protein